MSMLIKMVTITLAMNLFLYIGLNMIVGLPDATGISYKANNNFDFHFNGDILEKVVSQQQLDQLANNTNNGYTSYDINISGDIWKQPQQVPGGIGGLTTFIDVVNTVWDSVKLLFNIALSPLHLFFGYRMPVLIGLMIGLIYGVIFVLGIIFFIRGMPG